MCVCVSVGTCDACVCLRMRVHVVRYEPCACACAKTVRNLMIKGLKPVRSSVRSLGIHTCEHTTTTTTISHATQRPELVTGLRHACAQHYDLKLKMRIDCGKRRAADFAQRRRDDGRRTKTTWLGKMNLCARRRRRRCMCFCVCGALLRRMKNTQTRTLFVINHSQAIFLHTPSEREREHEHISIQNRAIPNMV